MMGVGTGWVLGRDCTWALEAVFRSWSTAHKVGVEAQADNVGWQSTVIIWSELETYDGVTV